MSKLSEIQRNLKAPKGQYNSFGKYKYRSCEDILEAVKPLLGDSYIVINDEIVLIGDRYYVKATATFYGDGDPISCTAYARESLTKKGMDESQITGSASSYSRKYALGGLLLTDDGQDADSGNGNTQKAERRNVTQSERNQTQSDNDVSDKLDLLDTLYGLAETLKGNEWQDYLSELSISISKGRVESVQKLSIAEINKLIAGISKKLGES